MHQKLRPFLFVMSHLHTFRIPRWTMQCKNMLPDPPISSAFSYEQIQEILSFIRRRPMSDRCGYQDLSTFSFQPKKFKILYQKTIASLTIKCANKRRECVVKKWHQGIKRMVQSKVQKHFLKMAKKMRAKRMIPRFLGARPNQIKIKDLI